jgi:hypothetical protein
LIVVFGHFDSISGTRGPLSNFYTGDIRLTNLFDNAFVIHPFPEDKWGKFKLSFVKYCP